MRAKSSFILATMMLALGCAGARAQGAAPSPGLKVLRREAPTLQELSGLDLAKIEKDGAPVVMSTAGGLVLVSRNAGPEALDGIAKLTKLPMEDAKQILSLAKSAPGQAILVGAAVGAGVITVANVYGVPGSEGFVPKYKYRLALGAALAGAAGVLAFRALRGRNA